MGSVEIQRHVQFGHPKSLNDAVSLAVEYESFDMNHTQNSKKPRQGGELHAIDGKSTIAELQKELEKVKRELTSLREEKAKDGQRGSKTQPLKDVSNVTCYFCKEQGHYQKRCPREDRNATRADELWPTHNWSAACTEHFFSIRLVLGPKDRPPIQQGKMRRRW